jgi:hypothetical protein
MMRNLMHKDATSQKPARTQCRGGVLPDRPSGCDAGDTRDVVEPGIEAQDLPDTVALHDRDVDRFPSR